MPPHNLLLFFMGGSLLWVGWFGLNAGSALGANQSGSMALMVTHISACSGGLSWMLLEWKLKGTQFTGSSERERNADACQEACYGPRDLL